LNFAPKFTHSKFSLVHTLPTLTWLPLHSYITFPSNYVREKQEILLAYGHTLSFFQSPSNHTHNKSHTGIPSPNKNDKNRKKNDKNKFLTIKIFLQNNPSYRHSRIKFTHAHTRTHTHTSSPVHEHGLVRLAEVIGSQSLRRLQQLFGSLGDDFEGRGHILDELLILAARQRVLANLDRSRERKRERESKRKRVGSLTGLIMHMSCILGAVDPYDK